LEKRGVPTVTICSDLFVPLAKMIAVSKGFHSLPLVIIPHPLGGLDPEKVRTKAEKAKDSVILALTQYDEKNVVH
jgi:hypothetical protein